MNHKTLIKEIDEIFDFIHAYEGTDYTEQRDKIISLLTKQRNQVIEEIRGLAERKSEVRTAKHSDTYEAGYDHGYDDKQKELIQALEQLKEK